MAGAAVLGRLTWRVATVLDVRPETARAEETSPVPTRLLYSARSWDDVIYRDELERLAGAGFEPLFTLTRSQPAGWTGYARRVDASLLGEVAPTPPAATFVCGPTPFVE